VDLRCYFIRLVPVVFRRRTFSSFVACFKSSAPPIAMQLTQFRLTRQNLRLGSGLILFAYVAAHLTNHALGLISIAAAEDGLRVAIAVWHSVPGTVLLYGAVAIHISLAFVALYERRTLRMPPLEALRIALGLGIPTLLIAHAVTTRLAFEAYGVEPNYARVVWTLWHSNRECRQMALLVPGWLHGCLGLNFAFGRRVWYQRLRFFLFGVALLLPVLALLGFLAMLKEVSLLAQDPTWIGANVLSLDAMQAKKLAWTTDVLLATYFAVIVAMFGARLLRRALENWRGTLVSITYPGRTVQVPRGWTVLEASRSHHIPHVSMCGGRARCSTCRVRIVAGGDHCPTPEQNELSTLNRIHAVPGTRLACQLRPQGNVTVVPLVAATPSHTPELANGAVERQIAIMVVDFRWTARPRRVLPQDLLYLLNRYSEIVGDTVRTEGGIPIQFFGDGVMALFGLEVEAREANGQALSAAARVQHRLHALGDRLALELGSAADFVIYLHTGSAGVGESGDHATRTLAAVGNTIDVARQLAAQRDNGDVERIVLSEAVMIAAGVDTRAATWREIVLPTGERFKVTWIDSVTAPLVAKSVMARKEQIASAIGAMHWEPR
jgi:adenylate cyclase